MLRHCAQGRGGHIQTHRKLWLTYTTNVILTGSKAGLEGQQVLEVADLEGVHFITKFDTVKTSIPALHGLLTGCGIP